MGALRCVRAREIYVLLMVFSEGPESVIDRVILDGSNCRVLCRCRFLWSGFWRGCSRLLLKREVNELLRFEASVTRKKEDSMLGKGEWGLFAC